MNAGHTYRCCKHYLIKNKSFFRGGWQFSCMLKTTFTVNWKWLQIKKAAISPVLAVGFERFFYGQMQNFLDKLNMIGQDSLDITCKNEWAIFTCWISLTGPFKRPVKYTHNLVTFISVVSKTCYICCLSRKFKYGQNSQNLKLQCSVPTWNWHPQLAIDDYAKDGGPGAVWHFCSFYHNPLRVL